MQKKSDKMLFTNVFKEKYFPLLEQAVQSLQNHFEHSSVGCWPLVSGGGNTLETFCALQ